MPPSSYPKRYLIAVVGLTPQILTETLWALTQCDDPFIPTEIHVITTSEGAHRLQLQLLDPKIGHFHQFCAEYGFTGTIQFSPNNIKVLEDKNHCPMPDIVAPEDNNLAADQIIDWLRNFTKDSECAIHACLAGGRKTMGFYLGYGLSLFGRTQDRLSHVLVSKEFESHKKFFYKPKEAETLFVSSLVGNRMDEKPLSTHEAKIWLADIPFVRLRDGLPSLLLDAHQRYSETVNIAQRNLPDNTLIIDFNNHSLVCGGTPVRLTPKAFAFYAWHAQRKIDLGDQAPISWKQTLGMNSPEVTSYLKTYLKVLHQDTHHPDYLNAMRAYANGFTKDPWADVLKKANDPILTNLGHKNARSFLIAGSQVRSGTLKTYTLNTSAERIRFQ